MTTEKTMIVITDLPKHSLVHSRDIKKWLADYMYLLSQDHPMTKATERTLRDIETVINTIDDVPPPF